MRPLALFESLRPRSCTRGGVWSCAGGRKTAALHAARDEVVRARAGGASKSGDFEDAHDAAKSALQAAPNDPAVRLLSAHLALARLDYDEAVKLTEGMQTTESHALRGRAFWYRGDLEQAADELEAMLSDPNVKDEWAREVAGLARRGVGRHPFEIEGGLVGSVEMPPAGPALVGCLARAPRGGASPRDDRHGDGRGRPRLRFQRKEAAWVNLRFGDKMEVKDVPAITQDLSGVSRQMGAPIKLLIGVNLLRHAHATFDRRGDQFDRSGRTSPRRRTDATRVPLWYVRGGGMLVRAHRVRAANLE